MHIQHHMYSFVILYTTLLRIIYFTSVISPSTLLGIFRGRGDTKTPLLCTTFGSIINILLDPLLIFNLNMGCAGAGAATAISQWCSAIPMLYYLNKSTSFIKYFNQATKKITTSITKFEFLNTTLITIAPLLPLPLSIPGQGQVESATYGGSEDKAETLKKSLLAYLR